MVKIRHKMYKYSFKVLFCSLTFIFFWLIFLPNKAYATTYYVDDSTGDNGNAGTSTGDAWATIQHASDTAIAGDTVYIRSGDYNEGVRVMNSGTEHQAVSDVTLSEGNKATFPSSISGVSAGDYLFVYLSWKSNNGVFLVSSVGSDYVVVDGTPFVDESTNVKASIATPIIFTNYSGETVTIYPTSPRAETLDFGYWSQPASTVSYNIWDGINIRGSDSAGVNILYSSHNVIRNASVYENDAPGFYMINGSTYNIVDNNNIYNNGQAQPGEGVYIGVHSSDDNDDYNHVINNHIHDFATGDEGTDIKENILSTVVEGNTYESITSIVSGNGVVGLSPGANNTLIYGNIIRNCSGGATYSGAIEINGPSAATGVQVFNNLIYDNTGLDGINFGRSTDNKFYHNTIYGHDVGIGVGGTGSATGTDIIDNILSGNTDQIATTSNVDDITIDHNVIYGTSSYSGTNAVTDDPLFVNAGSDDFHLQRTSPAIDAGISAGITSDLSLTTRPQASGYDMGAYEYIPLTVTVEQDGGQADPTASSPINFAVTFSESVSDFGDADVTLSGTAGATTATVTGSGTTYNIAVSGMTGSGTVIASLSADVATGATGNTNTASTSTDNTVTYDVTAPTLTSITISDTGGYTTDSTPDIDIVSSGSPSHAAFSCNGGTNWSSWIVYSDTISTFDITSGATGCTSSDGSKTVTAKLKDALGNESGTTNDTTYYDTTAPSGGSISYTDGYYTAASVSLTVDDGTDSGSGGDTSSRTVQRKSATLTADSCGSYGSFSTISPSGTYPNLGDTTVSSGNCYQYQYLVSDNLSNQATFTSSNTAKVDTQAPSTPGTPSSSSSSDDNTPTWTWTASTDSASGLAATPYTLQWSEDENFASGVSSTTSSTNSFTHSTSLSDGTWYFRVKADDAAGNTSSYSSNGSLTVDTSTTTPVSTGNSTVGTPQCTDTPPRPKASWLYGAIAQDSKSILLYFTEADTPVDKYVLEFGTKSGEYIYGVQDMGVNSRSQMTFLVESLSPATTYYFRVRAGNGCATGPWSNEISAKTKSLSSSGSLEVAEVQPTPTEPPIQEEPAPETPQKTEVQDQIINVGYKVKVKVIDSKENPVGGAKVTLHSTPREAITDNNGQVEFENVEEGQHTLTVAYDNYQGEKLINLAGSVAEINVTITVEPKSPFLSPLTYVIIGVTAAATASLAFLITLAKRKAAKATTLAIQTSL